MFVFHRRPYCGCALYFEGGVFDGAACVAGFGGGKDVDVFFSEEVVQVVYAAGGVFAGVEDDQVDPFGDGFRHGKGFGRRKKSFCHYCFYVLIFKTF